MPNDEQFKTIAAITLKLAQLGHEVTFVEPITTGPLVTTYRFAPRSATKVTQICGCAQDLALTLAVDDILVRRIPGEAVIGVSVPNKERQTILWRDTMAKPDDSVMLPLNLGVDSQGRLFRDDLTKCPHLLIAGTTGGGKSTLLNSVICSMMYWRSAEQVQFVMSDTKNVEFGHYIGAPHLLFEPSTTMYSTWERMDWLIDEMERRLVVIGRAGQRNILDYNRAIDHLCEYGAPRHMSYIVFVIDELADVLGGDKRGEGKIANAKLGRIVQKSRAAGVYVIAATQRPSVNIITGSIKSNFPARLTFKLPSQVDSRTVIDADGAEHLLTQGDMLYLGPAAPAIRRLHAAYASVDDVKECVRMLPFMEAQRHGSAHNQR